MSSKRHRRKLETQRRRSLHAPTPPTARDLQSAPRVQRLAYTRRQAADALGVSVATLDRRVVPAIETVKTEWGARLIPVDELERYLAERIEEPRSARQRPARSGRRSTLAPDVIARIHHEYAQGESLAEIARRLNLDRIPTAQSGRQWWPSAVRAVVLRTARADGAPGGPKT